jgi:hypothetical protein
MNKEEEEKEKHRRPGSKTDYCDTLFKVVVRLLKARVTRRRGEDVRRRWRRGVNISGSAE